MSIFKDKDLNDLFELHIPNLEELCVNLNIESEEQYKTKYNIEILEQKDYDFIDLMVHKKLCEILTQIVIKTYALKRNQEYYPELTPADILKLQVQGLVKCYFFPEVLHIISISLQKFKNEFDRDSAIHKKCHLTAQHIDRNLLEIG